MPITGRNLPSITKLGSVCLLAGFALCVSGWLATPAASQPPRAAEKTAAEAERRERELQERELQGQQRSEQERQERERAERRGQNTPSRAYLQDDVQYFPGGPGSRTDKQDRQQGKVGEHPPELSVVEVVETALDHSIERRLAILRIEQAELELKQVERDVKLRVTELVHHMNAIQRELVPVLIKREQVRQLRMQVGDGADGQMLANTLPQLDQQISKLEAERNHVMQQLQLLMLPIDDEDDRDEGEDEKHFRERAIERIPADIRSALSDRTSVDFVKTPLSDAMAFLQDVHGIKIAVDDGPRGELSQRAISLSLQNTSLAATLQAISDLVDDAHFYVRPYGLLVSGKTTKGGLRLEDYQAFKDSVPSR